MPAAPPSSGRSCTAEAYTNTALTGRMPPRLHRGYERKAGRFLAFTVIACALIRHRRLTQRDEFFVGIA
ncbi:hypothetical protein Arub01_48480 [Actinomadura rubrobrunea]|uniref:Uncharacterized protein n=1 Tax=Actinomadura rubrobrunea TaxID=115335 RepID=A0A9W6UWV2_9ACTN|nr:hypothetical protein Arub01_48480 [Actinomadura rubrobrunea]